MADIDLRHLHYFVAAADCRSFMKAAKRVNVSQPAITKSIQRMERWFGHTLFERGAELGLTPFGESLLEDAKEILRGFEDLTLAANLFHRNWAGTLRIGVGPLMTETILGEAVGRLIHIPGVKINMTVANHAVFPEMLRERRIDLFIADISELPGDAAMKIDKLRPSRFQWFGRKEHPLARRCAVPLSEVLAYPVVLPELPLWTREWFASHLPRDFEPGAPLPPFSPAVLCSHFSTIQSIILGSNAVSAMTELALNRSPYANEVAVLDCKEETPSSKTGIVSMKKRLLPPIAQKLIEEVIRISEQT